MKKLGRAEREERASQEIQRRQLLRKRAIAAIGEGDMNELRRIIDGACGSFEPDMKAWPSDHALTRVAIDADNIEALRALLDAGASLELQDDEGARLTHRAALLGRSDALEELLSRGADPSARLPIDRRSPLMIAAFGAHWRCALALMKAGARLDDQDAQGLTARDWRLKSAVANALVLELLTRGEDSRLGQEFGPSIDARLERGILERMVARAPSKPAARM